MYKNKTVAYTVLKLLVKNVYESNKPVFRYGYNLLYQLVYIFQNDLYTIASIIFHVSVDKNRIDVN